MDAHHKPMSLKNCEGGESIILLWVFSSFFVVQFDFNTECLAAECFLQKRRLKQNLINHEAQSTSNKKS